MNKEKLVCAIKQRYPACDGDNLKLYNNGTLVPVNAIEQWLKQFELYGLVAKLKKRKEDEPAC